MDGDEGFFYEMLGDLIRGRQEPDGHNPRLRTNVAYAVSGFAKCEEFGQMKCVTNTVLGQVATSYLNSTMK